MYNTTIRIAITTREELKKIGCKSDTYNKIILELLDHIQTCDNFWVTRN